MAEEKQKEQVPGVSPPPREAVAVQGVPWGETYSCGCFGASAVPLPAPSPALCTPPFRQGNAREGDAVEKPQGVECPSACPAAAPG